MAELSAAEKIERMSAQIHSLQCDLAKVRKQRDEQAIRAGIAERQQRDMRRELDRVRERLRDHQRDQHR